MPRTDEWTRAQLVEHGTDRAHDFQIDFFGSADDVGLDEIVRAVYLTVDVAFGGEMHDRTRPVLAQQFVDQGAVVDVAAGKYMRLIVADLRQVFEIAGVSQLVEIEHAGLFPREPLENEIGADETGAAGDEYQDGLSAVALLFYKLVAAQSQRRAADES